MSVSRRAMFAKLLVFGLANALLASRQSARAENVTYGYDALGRLISVTYGNGETVTYTYDAAGNRTQLVQTSPPPPPPPPPGFNATIAVTGAGPVNLRTLANTAGYNGAQNATVAFEVNSGVTITGAAAGGLAIDTGTWPTGTYAIALSLLVKTGGAVHGGGGTGGAGASATANGQAGIAGGDAIYCRLPMSVTVQTGASVKSGGGGGGGAGATSFTFPGGTGWNGGGGGGGGFPNGAGGAGGIGMSGGNGAAGAAGTTSGGGAGGNGNPSGAAGGGEGTAGGAGTPGNTSGGAGGAAGYATRKNGNAVTVTNNGTIAGAVG
ncbi:MAG: RHS repeat domain-containing protein [Terricaulis sp.]